MRAYKGLMDPTSLCNEKGSIPDDDAVDRKVNLLCGGKARRNMSPSMVRELFNHEDL
jgi:hypothetical protein